MNRLAKEKQNKKKTEFNSNANQTKPKMAIVTASALLRSFLCFMLLIVQPLNFETVYLLSIYRQSEWSTTPHCATVLSAEHVRASSGHFRSPVLTGLCLWSNTEFWQILGETTSSRISCNLLNAFSAVEMLNDSGCRKNSRSTLTLTYQAWRPM